MKFQLEKLGPGPKDRPLSKEELEFEAQAEKLPLKTFARIDPTPGTVGFLLRNLEGGNYAVINYLRELSKVADNRFGTYYNKVKKLLKWWDELEEYSRKRVDLWDHVCSSLKIPSGKFIGFVTEGAFEYAEAERVLDNIATRRKLMKDIETFAGKERNFKDRELLSKATKLINDTPLVNIDNSTVNNSLTLEMNNGNAFKDKIKRYDDTVDGELVEDDEFDELPEGAQRQLSEGNSNYVNVLSETRKDEQLVRR